MIPLYTVARDLTSGQVVIFPPGDLPAPWWKALHSGQPLGDARRLMVLEEAEPFDVPERPAFPSPPRHWRHFCADPLAAATRMVRCHNRHFERGKRSGVLLFRRDGFRGVHRPLSWPARLPFAYLRQYPMRADGPVTIPWMRHFIETGTLHPDAISVKNPEDGL